MTDAQMADAATGEVFTAENGIALGLVDSVASWESVLADTSRGVRATTKVDSQSAALPSETITEKELAMSALKQAQAIINQNPAHAAMVWEMVAKDATEEQILAAISAKDIEIKAAADAAELIALKARVDVAEKAAVDAKSAMIKAEAERDTEKARADALANHVDGSKADTKAKNDGDKQEPRKVTRAEFNANQAALAADIRRGAVVVAD